ncbi:myotubularin-related protein 13-like isoform X3 [Penaeus chinensis]|uniref:myotubularin-related protein 13-like isoform X3 n=1 Tax=Penaeus chinensis TaxID=139456 RepID=UPI001FB62D0F|nr:myotubularin-related protein 13-like isoform X3 [Penaeus chinensis]
MSRLADYFAIVGYDHTKDRNGISSGKIIQRFPERDWPDTPFIESLELFCQPQGWALSTERQEPKFFVSVLTDIDAKRHYCAVLCFNEAVSITPSKPTDEEDDSVDLGSGGVRGVGPPVPLITHHSIMYAPKCLVLISTLDYFETFRNCMGIVYTVYMEGLGVSMETLIGNMVGYVQVPPPGGPQVRFSIGAGDRQALQPPASPTLPVTGTTVLSLFNQLGVKNVLVLFCAALTEHKILFHSQSYNRLTESCHALKALLYPFKYSHVYIPILPASLVEVLSTPTPFIMGVHSHLQHDVVELMDVIVADLDGGSIRVPESLTVSLLPEPFWSQTHAALSKVLHPDLSTADNAFPSSAGIRASPHIVMDKEIRAVFMRMFAELLQGYRSCLTIIRIHSKPVITFHKASFLGNRGMVDNEFVGKVLDCMFFTTFVTERGPPWRVCDLWDDLYSGIGDQLRLEQHDSRMLLVHIQQELGQQLYSNENPNPQPFVAKIPKPTEGSFTRIHQPVFPHIDAQQVQSIIDEGTAKKVKIPQKVGQPRIVPMGPHISSLQSGRGLVSSSARRLEVMRNCVNCIFENKISDARKTFPAVLRALKSKAARLALCTELSHHVQGNKAVLEHQQFDLVVRLMNCALQDDSPMDEHGVAAALLPLSTAFCRKLCTGVIQFAYTCIQDHSVWGNQQFWEAAFYQDVQKEIKSLYHDRSQQASRTSLSSDTSCIKDPSLSPVNPRDPSDSGSWKESRLSFLRPHESSALEIAAEQMRLWPNIETRKQREIVEQEESTLYSQAIHYANRMVFLRVPIDVNAATHRRTYNERDTASNSITNSMAESDSLDAESGFEDQEQSDREASVVRFVARFVDKVCTEGGVTEEHIKSLHQMIPGVVAMHVEMLDAVYKESKRLPPIQKSTIFIRRDAYRQSTDGTYKPDPRYTEIVHGQPKILLPSLVPGEEVMYEGLRVYLLPDGREDATGGSIGGPILLPAEGALFLTNYRLIFKGLPTDPYACEQVVVRSMPVSSITREKRVPANQHPGPMDQWLSEGLQIRSNTFQLIKVAFDEEVSPESIETMRKLINRLRHPPYIMNLFAFVGHSHVPQTPSRQQKDKPGYGTLRGFAKKTLMKTAKVAGLKSGKGNKRNKYHFPSNNKSMTSPGRMSLAQMANMDLSNENLAIDDDLSVVDEHEASGLSNGSTGQLSVSGLVGVREVDSKTLEKLSERSYHKDYMRLGLGSLASNSTTVPPRTKSDFRITTCNVNYQLCRSYPALLSVPPNTGDDSIHRLARCYRQNRLPVITWRHPRNKALLLRGASFHGKGVMSMLKGPPTTTGTTSEVSYSVEQEKYLAAVVQATPLSVLREGSTWRLTGSSPSINSLVLAAGGATLEVPPYHPTYPTLTPEVGRKSNPLSKAMNTLRTSGGKGTGRMGRWGSLRGARPGVPSSGGVGGTLGTLRHHPTSTPALRSSINTGPRLSVDSTDMGTEAVQSFHKAALYVFGEKTQIKGIKTDAYHKTEFIPVEYTEVRQIKSSFKKLMRACVPSSPAAEQEQSFFRAIENSEWLNQLETLLQVAGAIVDLIDLLGASVMLLLEDGWDFTAQVTSIAQLCLDPYYRTIEGFRVLIEKEWLAFGHRFNHRSNLLQGSQASGFAPIFLQFLDAVHQIQRQFPLSFEFNEYYLRFLAYHYVSARFRTFLSDSELERAELGIMTEEDKRGSLSRHHKGLEASQDDDIYPGGGRVSSPGSSGHLGTSVFDYIEKHSGRHSSFYNFLYVGDRISDSAVLRPVKELSALQLWSYLIGEELRHGPSYDPEVRSLDRQQEEEAEAADGTTTTSQRRIVISGYDCVWGVQADTFTAQLEELRHLELELGHLPQKWNVHWDKLELPPPEQLTRQVSMTTQMVRHHGRSVHKRSTIEILIRGKTSSSAGGGGDTPQGCYSHPHRFEKYNYTTPSYCDHCSSLLWGPLKTGMRCMDCGYNCHEKCIESVPKNCTRFKSVRESGVSIQTSTKPTSLDNTSVGSGVTSLQTTSHQYYEQFSSNVAENRTHEGYLWKRGSLLKNWKQRWFVLDSMKHQLRYYDSMEDSHFKGIIELSDVVAVVPSGPTQGAPKKVDERAFFDLQTKRRLYNFCASDGAAAQEWIEKIQSCLQ